MIFVMVYHPSPTDPIKSEGIYDTKFSVLDPYASFDLKFVIKSIVA